MPVALFFLVASLVAGADPAPTDPVAGEPAATRQEAIEEGQLLYGIYCESCHGAKGRGDGPMASSLSPRPVDLTRLSRNNAGEFPLARVILSIDGRNRIPGHRAGRMPIWGLTLQEPGTDTNQEAEIRDKIERIVAYLKSFQVGAAPARP